MTVVPPGRPISRRGITDSNRAFICASSIELLLGDPAGRGLLATAGAGPQHAHRALLLLYRHFSGKDELVAECLRRFDPDVLPEVFERDDLTPRERLLTAFDLHAPLCPFIAAAVEIPDPGHPARVCARDYELAFARRLIEAAREAGAADPEQLGEQLQSHLPRPCRRQAARPRRRRSVPWH
ncbi:hypothetical protein V3N99_07400 [Dermatophilaceae bacterium Soc4.6]